jgi:hypothetical protein
MSGRVPKNQYVCEGRRNFQPNPSKWIIYDGCQREVYIECVLFIRQKIMNDSAVPKTIKKMDVWCQLILLLSQQGPEHDHQIVVINLPAHIAHCCRLKAEVKYKRNLSTHIKKKKTKGIV